MPFLSKDWRSPGEEWIRYEGGWEKRKTVILVPRPDIDSENKLSPSLDLAEFDQSNFMVSPKKIFRRQSSKLTSVVDESSVKENEEFLLIEQHLDNTIENLDDSSKMDDDSKINEPENDSVSGNSATSSNSEAMSNIVAGCRPKIKTKPIIIPKSDSKTLKDDPEEFDDIKPLQPRYSYSNEENIQKERLSTTLPRNRSGRVSFESKYNQDISSSEQFGDDMDEEVNEINDEYEKVNNPLSYHLKQHFRMRRRKRSQRSQSINEPTSHHQQVADKVKLSSSAKMECDNGYDDRKQIKDNKVPSNNENRGKEPFVQPQRSSGSPTSNIWLRLIEDEENIGKPFYPITLRNTKEVAGFNGLAEALIRLDFSRALRDVRRFNYVASLMQLLFSHDKLSQLPGAAQKVLFRMLEVVADTVYSNDGIKKEDGGRRNEHVLRRLLEQLHTTMAIYHVWGSPFLGGGHLIKQHRDTRQKITGFVEKMQTEFKQDLAAPGMVDRLPEECVREILLRLNDPSDILRAGQSCVTMDRIVCEKRVWRELVQTHFTKAQIEFILAERPELKDNKDWQALHTALRRRYGIRQNFTEMLMLCRRCCALFWKSIGHPCLVPEHITMSPASCPASTTYEQEDNIDEKGIERKSANAASALGQHSRQRAKSGEESTFEPSPDLFVPVTPQTFLTFFSV